MIRALFCVLLLTGCGATNKLVKGTVTTTITQNEYVCQMGNCTAVPVKSYVLTGKADAVTSFTDGEVSFNVDNRGSKSFTRSVAEKLVENAEVVLAPGVDSVGGND